MFEILTYGVKYWFYLEQSTTQPAADVQVSLIFGLLSGVERSSEPLEAGPPAGSGSDVSLRYFPSLLHPLRTDVKVLRSNVRLIR